MKTTKKIINTLFLLTLFTILLFTSKSTYAASTDQPISLGVPTQFTISKDNSICFNFPLTNSGKYKVCISSVILENTTEDLQYGTPTTNLKYTISSDYSTNLPFSHYDNEFFGDTEFEMTTGNYNEDRKYISVYAYNSNLSGTITIYDSTIYATSLSLKPAYYFTKDKSKKINCTVTPSNADCNLEYTIDNEDVAEEDEDIPGKISAEGMGITTLTITDKYSGLSCKTKIIVNKGTHDVFEKDTLPASYFINHPKAKKIKWKSSNSKIIAIKGKKFKCLKVGKAKLTCKLDGVKYTLTIYVDSKEKTKKAAIKYLKDSLKNPDSLKVNKISYIPGVFSMDYSAMNGFGGYNRETLNVLLEKHNLHYLD